MQITLQYYCLREYISIDLPHLIVGEDKALVKVDRREEPSQLFDFVVKRFLWVVSRCFVILTNTWRQRQQNNFLIMS